MREGGALWQERGALGHMREGWGIRTHEGGGRIRTHEGGGALGHMREGGH